MFDVEAGSGRPIVARYVISELFLDIQIYTDKIRTTLTCSLLLSVRLTIQPTLTLLLSRKRCAVAPQPFNLNVQHFNNLYC